MKRGFAKTSPEGTGSIRKASMNEQTRELIAIGAAVCAHCQPCLRLHVTRARELGIADDAIGEAIAVGHQVEKGAMSAMREFSSAALSNNATGAET